MRLLFIKPKHIGDSLLLTPTLVAARQAYPEAEIWVLVRRGCESILAGCPEIDRVLTLAGVDKDSRTAADALRQAGILALLAVTRFDYVFELGDGHRGRLFARAARTSRRYSVLPDSPLKGAEARAFTGVSTFPWRWEHRVAKDYRSVAEFLPLPEEIPPLRYDRACTRAWAPAAALDDFVVLQTGTRQAFNRWNIEGWRALCAHLLARTGAIILSTGAAPEEVSEADTLRNEFGPRVLPTRGQANWSEIAGLLYRARLYVGPATAAMHLAAACGCPSVALMGRAMEEHFGPWRAPYRAVTTADVSKVSDPEERERLIKSHSMNDTPLPNVLAACDEMLALPRRTGA
jgi:heptosyltransferase-3